MLVNNQQFFNPVFVQDFFCLLKRGAGCDGDEIFPCHDLADALGVVGFKTQVAVGENADQFAVLDHGKAGNLVFIHQLKRVVYFLVRINGYGVDNHAAFRFFYSTRPHVPVLLWGDFYG